MNTYQSLSIFPLDVLNALYNAEVLSASVLLHNKEAACVHVARMDVDHEVLEAFDLCLSVIVVAQEFLHKVGFGFFQGNVVGVAAKDVLELALELIDIIIVLSSELELNLLVLCLDSLLLFSALVEILSQVVDDPAVVMSVLLPEDAELVLVSLRNVQDRITNLESVLDQGFEIGLVVVLDIDGKVSFGFVEPDIRRVNIVIFEECFLNISKGNGLFLVDCEGIDHTKSNEKYT